MPVRLVAYLVTNYSVSVGKLFSVNFCASLSLVVTLWESGVTLP